MIIAVAQTNPRLGDLENNLAEIERLIESTEAELIVFPELAITGYLFHTPEEARPYARQVDSSEVKRLQKRCKEQRKSIIVGHLEEADDRLFNSALFIDHRGELIGHYRKTHLFHFEKQVFTPGDTGFKVFKLTRENGETVKVGIMICYDWRFPESARSLALAGADIIAVPSCIVTRTGMLHTVLQARAFENKVILAFADRVGTEASKDTSLTYRGESCIINYNGEILTRGDDASPAVLQAEVDPKATRSKSFSELNDIFNDRRPDQYRP
jgi:5-aminopentanamidase